MDESLKARLIGAAVLVLLAVLLIPELLSGRKAVDAPVEDGTGPRGTRTFTVELGGSKPPADQRASPAPVAMPTPQPAADTEQKEPVDEEAVAATPAPSAASEAPAPAPVRDEPAVAAQPREPAPPPKAAEPAPAASEGAWFVQVGAFGTAEAASRLVRDLRGDGYSVQVVPVARGGRTLHRVRVGPARDRPDADQLALRLKARGLPAAVVQND